MWNCPRCGRQVESEFGTCWDCRTDRDGPLVRTVARDGAFDASFVLNGPPWPFSEACPQCGERRHHSVRARPWFWSGLWRDRICPDCRVRYTPPTPGWLVVTYAASALVFVAAVAAMLAWRFLPGWQPVWVPVVCPRLGFVTGLIFCVTTQWHAPAESRRRGPGRESRLSRSHGLRPCGNNRKAGLP